MEIGLPGGEWMAAVRLVAAIIGGYFLVIWFASVLWVYRDIRSRTNDPISQVIGLAIAVVFPIVGLPVYLVLRPPETLQESYDRQLEQEALLSDLHAISACPDCRRPVSDEFMVCAYCATPLKQACAHCGHLLQFAWRYCPFCAAAQQRRQGTRGGRTGRPDRDETPSRGEPERERAARAEARSEGGAGDEVEYAGRRGATAAETPESRLFDRLRTDEAPQQS